MTLQFNYACLFRTPSFLSLFLSFFLSVCMSVSIYLSNDHHYNITLMKWLCITLNMIFSVIRYLMSVWQIFIWDFLWMSLQILSWMMDEFIHWPKPYLLFSTSCDEIMLWIIKICMKNHLVSDRFCNIVILQSPKKNPMNDK